jgi:Ca2+-transporting ATPase
MIVLFGAPEIVLAMTSVSEHDRREIIREIESRADSGERVLAIAIKEAPPAEKLADSAAKKDAEFLGLLAFRDKVRPSVRAAIESIERAGVRTIMVTGDHAGTAKTVAKELGFVLEENSVLLGSEITEMDDETLKERLKHTRVIARSTPEQKLRIARCFKALGEVVAMTGDGVNDAPALREANIGVAVGSGTDVAKSSADLVLLDNNFETIVAAVEEGRKVLQNVRKVIVYVLSNSFDELFLIGGSLLMGLALPLNALQILWVNLFTDSFPAVALAFESNKSDIGKKPSSSSTGLFDKEMQFLILVVGTITSVSLLVMYFVLLRMGFPEETVRTFIFMAFGTYTLFLVFSVRSLHTSILEYPLMSNLYLVGGALIGLMMMLAGVYVPLFQELFGTVPLEPVWIIGVLLFCAGAITLREAAKWLFRHGYMQPH